MPNKTKSTKQSTKDESSDQQSSKLNKLTKAAGLVFNANSVKRVMKTQLVEKVGSDNNVYLQNSVGVTMAALLQQLTVELLSSAAKNVGVNKRTDLRVLHRGDFRSLLTGHKAFNELLNTPLRLYDREGPNYWSLGLVSENDFNVLRDDKFSKLTLSREAMHFLGFLIYKTHQLVLTHAFLTMRYPRSKSLSPEFLEIGLSHLLHGYDSNLSVSLLKEMRRATSSVAETEDEDSEEVNEEDVGNDVEDVAESDAEEVEEVGGKKKKSVKEGKGTKNKKNVEEEESSNESDQESSNESDKESDKEIVASDSESVQASSDNNESEPEKEAAPVKKKKQPAKKNKGGRSRSSNK